IGMVESLPGSQSEISFRYTLLMRWAQYDPKAAMAYAEKLPPAPANSTAVLDVLEKWVLIDLPGAAEWVRQLPPGRPRGWALNRLMPELAEADPAAALDFLQTIGSGHFEVDDPDSYFAEVFKAWGHRDPATAANRAMQLPAGKERD